MATVEGGESHLGIIWWLEVLKPASEPVWSALQACETFQISNSLSGAKSEGRLMASWQLVFKTSLDRAGRNRAHCVPHCKEASSCGMRGHRDSKLTLGRPAC